MRNNLDLALRRPGQVLLLERGAAEALLDRSFEERRHPSGGTGLLSRAMGLVGLRPKAMEDDDSKSADAIDRSRLALPQIDWAGSTEFGEGYAIVDGIAIIDIAGVLTPSGYFDWWDWCWVGGYSQIATAIRLARADTRVLGIMLRIDSPGGYVDGCFDLADEISADNAKAGGKPVWVSARMACSAAYALASAADRITAFAEADVGSIGVLVMHVDFSGYYAEHGIKVEAIQSAPRKTDAADWKPLSDDARAHLQAVVDQIARRFSGVVTGGRGISSDDIAAMQARWFLAQHDDPAMSGLALGLVDEVATDRAMFAALKQSLAGSTTDAQGGPGSQAASDAARITANTETDMGLQEQIAALRDKAAKGDKDAKAELKKLGISLTAEGGADDDEASAEDEGSDAAAAEDGAEEEDEEQDEDAEPKSKATGTKAAFRLLGHKSAKGRESLANRLAEKVAAGKLSYGEARSMLEDAPKGSRLGAAMQGRDHNPGNDNGDAAGKASGLSDAVDRRLAAKK